MLERVQHCASGRNVCIALSVFLVALMAMNVAATLFYHASGGYGILDLGGGANLFDDRGSYTPTRAYLLIAHYGQSGIHYYYGLLIADLFFPVILGMFALLAIIRALGHIVSSQRWPYLLALLPLAYVLADWSENAGILTMLLNYPQTLFTLAVYTNIARGAKSVLATTSLLVVFVTWLLVLWRQHSRARQIFSR
jgi:hypothetical protein